MVYSDVINNNLHEIIGDKNKYTKSHIKKLMNKGYTEKQSIFILKCTAIYYNKDMSKYILNYNTIKAQLKRMF